MALRVRVSLGMAVQVHVLPCMVLRVSVLQQKRVQYMMYLTVRERHMGPWT
jgi:hypothetical protein